MKQERTIFFEDFDIEYYRHYILRYQKEEYSRIQHSLERMFSHYFCLMEIGIWSRVRENIRFSR